MGNQNITYGPLTQEISDAVNRIIIAAYENAVSAVVPSCTVPEGYVKIPDAVPDMKSDKTNPVDVEDIIKMALSAALPAGLAALVLALHAPAAAVAVMSGAGGVAGSFIQKAGNSQNLRLADPELQELNSEKLTADDIAVSLSVDPKKKKALIQESLNNLAKLYTEIASYEDKISKMHDISLDRSFGEWIQNFIMYVKRNPEDRKLQRMKDELIDRLEDMRIHVYDEVVLNDAGMPDVPIRDYLLDNHKGSTYEKVVRPAVYSDKALLARGVIS